MPALRRLPAPLALALLLLLPGLAPAQLVRARDPEGLDRAKQAQQVLDLLGGAHVLREAWRVTSERIYDDSRLPADWEAIRDRYAEEAARAATPEELHGVINQMLGELETSHLALMERRVFLRELYLEFRAQPTVRAGCELEELDGRLFVAAVAEAGPAADAGLRVGDEVVAIDGGPPAASGRLDPAGHDPGIGPGHPAFFLRVADATPIALEVRREAGGPTEALELVPRETSLVESTRDSARLVEVAGRTVGVIHLWHFMTPAISHALRDALRGELAGADALVLDVRGRGGSSMVVQQILATFAGDRALWDEPVVCVIDRGSRSAKEIFAYHWKRKGIGPLVGERTAGACIGCTFQQLSDGSILMLPVMDVRRLSGGVDLEGRGVAPTEPVDQLPLPYRGGADAILAAGLERAAELAGAAAGTGRAF